MSFPIGTQLKLTKEAEAQDDGSYNVTLGVEAKTTTSTTAASAATVLVVDTSGSMNWCAECRSENLHSTSCSHYSLLNIFSWAVSLEQTRLYAAKNAAIIFLNGYRDTSDARAPRYIAVVRFNSSIRQTEWFDVTTDSGYNSAVNAINSMTATGGTNLERGA